MYYVLFQCYSWGLNVSLIGLVQLASMCEELMMVCLDMRMYLLKQSLVHRPRLMMSHFGHPIAAAVVAAPIRRDWDVVLASPSVVSCSSWFMSFLVRYLLFWNVKRGPDLVG